MKKIQYLIDINKYLNHINPCIFKKNLCLIFKKKIMIIHFQKNLAKYQKKNKVNLLFNQKILNLMKIIQNPNQKDFIIIILIFKIFPTSIKQTTNNLPLINKSTILIVLYQILSSKKTVILLTLKKNFLKKVKHNPNLVILRNFTKKIPIVHH